MFALLVALAGSVVAAPASQAAGVGRIVVDPEHANGLIIDARGAAGLFQVTYDTSNNTVRFNYAGSWADTGPCTHEVTMFTDAAVCPGASVDWVSFLLSDGADDLEMRDICIPVTVAYLGNGDDWFTNLSQCSQPVQSAVLGGGGLDRIRLPAGDSSANGEDGNDQIYGGAGVDELSGGNGDDQIFGDAGNDTIRGDAGNDRLVGGNGNDVLNGGDGDDVFGGPGTEGIDPGNNDYIGGAGVDMADFVSQPSGMRISLDNVANDGAPGEAGNVRTDIEKVRGTGNDDVITGSPGNDYLEGSSGNDNIFGADGNDQVFGDSGNDTLSGGNGDDSLEGYSGDDVIDGGPGVDSIYGDYNKCDAYSCPGGSDKITARDGLADNVNCGPGADTVIADTVDVIAQDAFMQCESVDKVVVQPPPPPGGGTAPTVSIPATAVAKAGVRVALGCSASCSATAQALIAKKVMKKVRLKSTKVGAGKVTLTGPGLLVVKFGKKMRKRLHRLGKVKVTVKIAVTSGGTTTRSKRVVKVKF